MSDASMGLHEQAEKLSPATVDRHRAIVSLMEELEAIDWYDQRVAAATDSELAEILAHNRDEEKEHAAMTLEWLRRHDPVLDRELRTYLFASGPVHAVEDEATGREAGEDGGAGGRGASGRGGRGGAGGLRPSAPNGSLGIGSLRGLTE